MVCGPLRVGLCGVWSCGSSFGDPDWWSAISGFAWIGSFSGVLCARVSWGFVGSRGRLRIGLRGLQFLPDFYLILMNITSIQWKQTPFSNPAPKPGNSVN